jgi:hypothetical protein
MVSSLSLDPAWESEKEIFDKVRQYLRPGPWFRFITYLYAERKLVIFFLVHFMATMITWSECSVWIISDLNLCCSY